MDDTETRTLRLLARFVDMIEEEGADTVVSGAAATELLQRLLEGMSRIGGMHDKAAHIALALAEQLVAFADERPQ